MEDLTKILSFEVKKEIAERYFGFRKRIEDDKDLYEKRLTISSLELENKIGFDLIQIYILLNNQDLIHRFIKITGLPQDFFFDPYFLQSPTIRKKAFIGKKLRGWTRHGRYRNMFFDTYISLTGNIEEYCKTLSELTEEQETIREQIKLFYKKNDIDSIMDFIRRIDNPDPMRSEMMNSGRGGDPQHSLDDQMRLRPPLPANKLLPTITPLPQFKTIQPQLKQLIDEAYKMPRSFDLKAEVQLPD